MKKTVLFFLLPVLLLIHSCETDLEIADYKEIPIVYCIFNIKDSVHYVRLNKGFLTGDDAYNYVQNPDSVSYDPSVLEVFLYKIVNGDTSGNPVVFVPAPEIEKDSGFFSSQRNTVFKSYSRLDTTMEVKYLLKIRNKLTGQTAAGSTLLLGHYDLARERTDKRTFQRKQYIPEKLPEFEGSLLFTDYDIYIYRFVYYDEYIFTGDTILRYVDQLIDNTKLDESIKEDTSFTQFNDTYFEYLSKNIPVDPTVRRHSIGVDKMFPIASEELLTYIGNYSNPLDPHFNPSYTNIFNGLGVISSRYYYTFFAQRLNLITKDSLCHGRYTKNLGFLF